jgi:hypothetical protein
MTWAMVLNMLSNVALLEKLHVEDVYPAQADVAAVT